MLGNAYAGTPRARPGEVTVLVVDDDPAQRREIADYLRYKNFVVAEAMDGHGALKAIHILRPSVVLMDINLPGCDGIQATRVAMALHDTTSIILISGQAEDVSRAKKTDCGAVAVFDKPIKLHALTQFVRALAFRDKGRIVDERA